MKPMDARLNDIRYHVVEAFRSLSERFADDDSLRSIRVSDFSDGECERLVDALRAAVDDEGYQCERCEVVFVPCVTPTSQPVCEFCADQLKRSLGQ